MELTEITLYVRKALWFEVQSQAVKLTDITLCVRKALWFEVQSQAM